MSGKSNTDNSFEVNITEETEQRTDQAGNNIPQESEILTPTDNAEQLPVEGSEADKYLEQLQRLQAEYLNYKRRVEKERLELSNLFKSELVSSLLPVIDDFERMLNHSVTKNSEQFKGMKLIYQKLIDILREQGLRLIESKGQRFDPRIHEAILIENSENGEDEIVAEEWRKGYFFNDKLLRPAQVKVLKSIKMDES